MSTHVLNASRAAPVLLAAAMIDGWSTSVSAADTCPEIPSIRYESAAVVEREAGCEPWPFQPAKLGNSEAAYLQFGGEVRQRYEYTNNLNFGQGPDDLHGVWLQRFAAFGDWRVDDRWRMFAELHSVLENGRAAGPGPTDENRLDFQNAFIEARPASMRNAEVLLRAGRQELGWGASRLVSVRDGPNVRRTFDGLRLLARVGEWTFNAVAARPRNDEPGAFDDSTDESRALWGLYSTRTLGEDRGVDAYYLGYANEEPTYNQGTAQERRHTLGVRYFGSSGSWDWDIEPMTQFGGYGYGYGDGEVRAWTIATETGFTWRQARWSPRLMVSANVASGDRNPRDPDLETFSPLYPRGNYFSEDATLGPQNFCNAHLFLTLNPSSSWALTVDYNAFWRLSKDDGVYGPSGSVLRADSGSDERFVATALSVNSEWSVDRHWTLTAIYTHFSPRDFLEQTGPASASEFLELTARLRF